MADKRISQLVERTDIANNDVVPIVASGASTTNKATISSIQTYMQENLDVGVTSVGITLGSSGTDINVTGSPITTSGNITINIPTASATNRGLLSSADWSTFNGKQGSITLTTTGTSGASTLIGSTLNIPNYTTDLSGYVTLGTAQTITAQKTFTTSGSSDTMIISHGSGSGFALDVIKAGNGEAIRVTKTSGSGNAMTISGGNFEAGTIVKTGGTSSQFLKADGSVDSNSYALNSSLSLYLPLSGGTMTGILNVGSGNLRIAAEGASNITILRNFTGTAQGQSGFNHIGFNNSNNLYFTKNLNNGCIFSFNNSAYRTYTFPDADATIASTSNLSAYLPLAGGTLTGALNGTSASFSAGINAIGQEKGFTWQRVSGASSSDVYSLNADSASAYLQNDTTSNILMSWLEGGNVGVGTASPTNGKLEIQQSTTAPALWVQTGGTTSGYIIADFRTGTNAPALQILGNANSIFQGNVGIGTASPSYSLDVNGTTRSQGFITSVGTVSVPNLTWVTIYTIPSTQAAEGVYSVYGHYNDDAGGMAFSQVLADRTHLREVNNSDGTAVFLQISGRNVQVQQIYGTTLDIQFSVLWQKLR